MIRYFRLYLLCITLTISSMHGLIYQIDIYQSPQGAFAYLCKDEHASSTDKHDGEKQYEVITNILDEYKNKSLNIIENFAYYQGQDEKIRQAVASLQSASSGLKDEGLLVFLTLYCQKNNIPFINIDDRLHHELSTMGVVPIETFLQTFDASIKEIQSYSEAPLQQFYGDIINDALVENKKLLKFLRKNAQLTLKSLGEKYEEPETRRQFFTDCDNLIHDFLDARLIHQLAIHTSTDPIFAFVGGKHIDNILPHLSSIGYKRYAQLGKEPKYDKYSNIKKSSLFDIQEFAKVLQSNKRKEPSLPSSSAAAAASSQNQAAAAASAQESVEHISQDEQPPAKKARIKTADKKE